MNKEAKQKMIFAKATALNFYAIVVYVNNGNLMVCDIVESEDIDEFLNDVEVLARKHMPELLQYECSVYLHECRKLRSALMNDNIRVRGYRSEGTYQDRVFSQVPWIENHAIINEEFTDFIDNMISFDIANPDKANIALDILSDATKYLRRIYFK